MIAGENNLLAVLYRKLLLSRQKGKNETIQKMKVIK